MCVCVVDKFYMECVYFFCAIDATGPILIRCHHSLRVSRTPVGEILSALGQIITNVSFELIDRLISQVSVVVSLLHVSSPQPGQPDSQPVRLFNWAAIVVSSDRRLRSRKAARCCRLSRRSRRTSNSRQLKSLSTTWRSSSTIEPHSWFYSYAQC